MLVLSAGGEGNVAVPLLKGDLKESQAFNLSQIQNLLGFFGSVENGPRQRLLMKVCDCMCIYMMTCRIPNDASSRTILFPEQCVCL